VSQLVEQLSKMKGKVESENYLFRDEHCRA
jgi:hypothetical protein